MVERAGGRLTRIDNGGTFLMRAQAGRKPQALLNKATEIDGLFSSSINPSYAKIAKSAGYANARAIPNLKQQVNRITRLRDQSGGWGSYVNRVAPKLGAEDRAAIVSMLNARTEALSQLAGG